MPAIYVWLALGSNTARVEVIPVQNGTSAADSTANAKSIGEPFGLPVHQNERGWTYLPWDGKLESGKYAPGGRSLPIRRTGS
ncbi:hypothetical protein E4U60_007846 [Claviceps pazoutovae]|uniref:Uncharacterized protein n=1 Tax=Claviceps pazoutovae TaxID=1649127 RepID=A0A9P7M2F6_9HYPO|nr:hypothetical protein E4U60_007846 [Claviceps pazoutovae]